MNSLKKMNWDTTKRFVVAATWLALLLLLSGSSCYAQTTIKASDSVVDPAKPKPVTLHVTKAGGSIDTELVGRVVKVTVGGVDVPFTPDAQQGNLTITPPANMSGLQPVQLLDKDGKVGEVQLEYRSGSGPNATPTTDLARWREEKAEARRDRLAINPWFLGLVFVIFFVVLLPFVRIIVRGIRFARSTYNSPLGLPVGSFRAILAYSLLSYLGFYILTSTLSISYFAPPDFLLGIVATVIGFYFGSRSGEDAGPDAKAGAVRGIVRKDKEPAIGALVKFKRDDGTEPYSRITDVDGRFELRGAKPGKYKVSAALTGSPASDEKDITISEGSDHEIEIVIKSAATTAPPPAQTGAVQGAVKQPDGTTPAANAEVVLLQGGVKKFEAKTDPDGKYKIAGVAVGKYKIKASLSPHQPSDELDVEVTAGGQHTIDLKLK